MENKSREWILAKCENCGAPLRITEGMDELQCDFCGYHYLLKKVVNEYHLEVNNRIDAEEYVKHQQLMQLTKLKQKAKNLVKNGEIREAVQVCGEILELDPTDKEIAELSGAIQKKAYFRDSTSEGMLTLYYGKLVFRKNLAMVKRFSEYALDEIRDEKVNLFKTLSFTYHQRTAAFDLADKSWAERIRLARQGKYIL